ncbi:hydrolase [Aestuariivirga sp.]|uniref:hydrolase n=1 Tax=Aestuariivirga sp. TaxID=2650926 RepID=UPI0025BCC065|nr:hydrolase [Aestuariivirga sp.]MCA3555276.1 hydrolase [Aestuariivirga sp.]
MLVEAAKSTLLLVDMQERLLPAMSGGAEAEARCAILLKAARALGVPVTVSEQYPRGLGRTVPGLSEEAGNAPVFEKTSFSCWRDQGLKDHLIVHHEAGRPLVILAGIEAHVCVMQTAADLAAAGFGVLAVADAMASRAPASQTLALKRMRQHGVQVVNTEMVVFELLGRAGTAEFKALSALVR